MLAQSERFLERRGLLLQPVPDAEREHIGGELWGRFNRIRDGKLQLHDIERRHLGDPDLHLQREIKHRQRTDFRFCSNPKRDLLRGK